VLTDNYENLVRHPGDREHPQLVRALREGSLTLFGLKAAILACFGVALAIGAYLVHLGGVAVLVIGLASIAAAVLYSAGPSPFGARGLADPVFFAFFGTVSVVGAYYVQAAAALGPVAFGDFVPAALPLKAVALGLPIGALTTGILIIDDIRDREFDVVKGKNTVAVRFGAQWSRAEFMALLAFAYVAPLWFVAGLGFSAWVLLPLASLPYVVSIARAVLTLDRYEALVPLDAADGAPGSSSTRPCSRSAPRNPEGQNSASEPTKSASSAFTRSGTSICGKCPTPAITSMRAVGTRLRTRSSQGADSPSFIGTRLRSAFSVVDWITMRGTRSASSAASMRAASHRAIRGKSAGPIPTGRRFARPTMRVASAPGRKNIPLTSASARPGIR